MKETFCHNIFYVAKDPKHVRENYTGSTRYLLLLSKKYQTWENLKMSSTFLKHPRSLFLHLALVLTTQLLTLRTHSSSAGANCWVKAFGYVWGCGAVVLMHMSGFEMEEGPHCTQHLLSIPWLLLTKPGFVKRCAEGSRLQLSSFCLNVSTKSNNYTWEFPAIQLQIPWFLWRTHRTILFPYFHTFGYSLHYFYPDRKVRIQKHEERLIPLFFKGKQVFSMK